MKLSSFEALASALQNAGVRYLVAAGLAVGAHGHLRFTKDVDIVIELIPDNIERAFTAGTGKATSRRFTRSLRFAPDPH
jgi:hypothetical protein